MSSNTIQPNTASTRTTGNGFAVTALVLGIVGALFGLIPLTSFIALPLGVIGLVFGIVAVVLALRGRRGRKVMAIIGLALSAIALALGVWGMSILAKATDDLAKSVQSVGTPTQASASSASSPDEAATGGDRTSAFGGTITFDDGTKVSVSKPTARTFSQTSTDAGQKGIVVKVSVTAGKKAVTGATVLVNGRQGESEVPSVIDIGQNIDGSISNNIRPGKTVTQTYGFSTQGTDDLEIIVQPGFDYDEAVFTG